MPLAQERVAATEVKNTRQDRLDAVVICSDDSLLIELGPQLGDRFRIHTLDSPADLAAHVRGSRWIGIIDVDSLADPRTVVTRMEIQHRHTPLILVASRPEDWASAVARGIALAAVARDQVSGPALAEALLAAEQRLRAEPEVHHESAASREFSSRGAPHTAARGSLWAVVAVVALMAVTAIWLYHRHAVGAHGSAAGSARHATEAVATNTEPPPTAAGEAAAPGTAAAGAAGSVSQQQSVLELLSAARVAFRDQKLLLPRADGDLRGDSALELYAQVLSQDSQNDEALDGVRRLFADGRERITADLMAGRLEDASRLVGLFKTAGVDASELDPLTASISAARPKWLAQRATQAIANGDFKTGDEILAQLVTAGADANTLSALRTQMENKKLDLQLTTMAAQVHAAIESGALLAPAADNARTRLTAMRTLARAHPVTQQAQRELQTALVAAAQQATLAAQFEVAQRDLNAVAELGSFAPLAEAKRDLQTALVAAAQQATLAAQFEVAQRDLNAVAELGSFAPLAEAKRDLQTAMTANQHAAQARALAERNVATPSSSTPTPTPPRSGYIAAVPTRPLPLQYPDNANISGFVVVEFTLNSDGAATNATVVQASPRGVFERAALDAVQRGRFSTRDLVNGQPARARLRVRFNIR